MKNEIKVFDCGTRVVIKLGNLEGLITGISIRFGKASYDISYCINGQYKNIWMYEQEFTASDPCMVKIGFK